MLAWFAETTIVAGVLATVAIAACRLKRLSPSIRHALWLVVLIKLMTPPLVAWPWAARVQNLAWPAASPSTEITAAVVGPEQSEQASLPVEPKPLECEIEDDHSVPAEIEDAPPAVILASSEATPVEPSLEVVVQPIPRRAWATQISLPTRSELARSTVLTWLAVSMLLALGQAIRIIRFRRRLYHAVSAPDTLVDEAERLGRYLRVSVPEILVVPDLGTPLLWCLGRPLLLLPQPLVKTLPADRWRGILIHELAHLRRGDHWVSRLELIAGLFWWWNPLYWLTRARLDAESELACDAWVISTLPKDRLTYAEVLFDICATLSLAKPAAPVLGVAGSGRFFEQRLTMILHDHVRCRLSPLAILGAFALVLFALPSWVVAKPVVPAMADAFVSLTSSPMPVASFFGGTTDDDDKAVKRSDDDDDDDDDADDDDDDDDDDKAAAKAKAEAAVERAKAALEAAQAKLATAKAQADAAKSKGQKAKAKASKSKEDLEIDLSGIEKEIESRLGPDFEKKMEELGEKIGKEIEAKFGPDFEKKMEAFGKEIEEKFGPEFEKKMEAFGKEMEEKFGSGSEFAKKMEAFGKEMEAKLGSGSEFAKKMEAFGKEMEAKFGPDSDFAKKIKEKAAKGASPSTSSSKSSSSSPEKPEVKVGAKLKSGQRERRIKELEAQIKKLIDEVKSLEDSDDQDDDDDDDDNK
jgi:beta-lactamase regulating signal transducer with metallopeptidase domain